AGGENFKGNKWATDGIWLSTSGLPQPGPLAFAGGPACTRYVEELDDTIVLPGCRGVNAVLNRDRAREGLDDFVMFRFDQGWDPRIDGCMLGATIDGRTVRGIDEEGNSVDHLLAMCNDESSHKIGGFYVWPCTAASPATCETDPVVPPGTAVVPPDLVDWAGGKVRGNTLAEMSRTGAGTLWHPYAGCF
ncbi:MAG: hypothetical protein GY778_17875, partial [bacterium]|nr:hypothetical protein [bacterium]